MSINTVTLRFIRNAVAYGNVCIYITNTISFCITEGDDTDIVQFFMSTKQSKENIEVTIQYHRKSDRSYVSESFHVSGNGWTEKEFKL